MVTDFVGQGWDFPPRINRQGGLALVRGEAEINQSIQIILMTTPGQRVMRPTFGSQLHELMFGPNNSHTAALAKRYVKDALGMWEPRINVLEVDAYPDDEHQNRMLIEILYEIKTSYDKRSLVFPFYLIPDE
jgi:uncharacterized protein